MATKVRYESLSSREKRNRYFSEEFKKDIVKAIERKKATIAEVSREYEVSRTSIYHWQCKYSILKKRGMKQIIEPESLTKKLEVLKEEIKDLKSIIGEKQITIEFQEKLIKLVEEHYKIDIKKNFGEKLSSGSGTTGKATVTK